MLVSQKKSVSHGDAVVTQSAKDAPTVSILSKMVPSSVCDHFKSRIMEAGEQFTPNHKTTSCATPELRDFIKNPNLQDWLNLSEQFLDTYLDIDPHKFLDLENVLITPTPGIKVRWYSCPQNDLSAWHQNQSNKYESEYVKGLEKKERRLVKIEEMGPGMAGTVAKASFEAKEAGLFIRDQLTLRGQVYNLSDRVFGTTLNELLPNYGVRKATMIGMRITEAYLNGILAALGFGLAPVTLGLSEVASSHLRSGVTVGIEATSSTMLGVQDKKIAGRTAMRTVQMETPKFVPVVGDIVEMAETGVTSVGLGVIVSSVFVDLVMRATSDRYVTTFSPEDLGDSRVLGEMTDRLKYLSQFLVPYGQKLLFESVDKDQQKEIMGHLRNLMDAMRDMEIRRTKALYFYALACVLGRVPPDLLEQIKKDCLAAMNEGEMDCHQTAKSCLATLNMLDEQKKRFRGEFWV
jgi:hypothetical protein